MAIPGKRPPNVCVDPDTLTRFCERWNVAELSLFGSALREDFGPDSDVDLLVRFRENATRPVFDLVHMAAELEALFGRRVDLVVENALRNPFRRHAILTSKRPLYAT